MNEETDDTARTRRIQLLTCECCRLAWPSPLALRAHLLAVGRSIAAKLAELERAKL